MKRKYEVVYYEYELTTEVRKKFFFKFTALLYAFYIYNRYNGATKVRVYGELTD
jgi:hypothetical protein